MNHSEMKTNGYNLFARQYLRGNECWMAQFHTNLFYTQVPNDGTIPDDTPELLEKINAVGRMWKTLPDSERTSWRIKARET